MKRAILITSIVALALPAAAVLFRLPLSSDTAVHYYYDHDSSSGIRDWKCATETYNGHRGTDFSGGPRGRAIFAGGNGTLEYKIDGFGDGHFGSTDGGGFGNYVRLGHANNFKTYYAHMTINSVTTKAINSAIVCGEQIGGVGTSGSSTGFHLHFEPRISGSPDDPYSGACGGPITYWVNQNNGQPTTDCEGAGGIPPSPANLSAITISQSQINLSWIDNAGNESGFKIERALLPNGPWSQIATISSNLVTYSNSGLTASSTYFYRMRSYNSFGDSAYSNLASSTTSNTAPNLPVISNKTVAEHSTLLFTNTATDAGLGITQLIADFENYANGASSVMFRQPSFSSSSSAYLDASPNVTAIASAFPAGNLSSRTLNVNCSFTNTAVNPWLRLTTFDTTGFPNTTISIQQILRFDIRTDKSLRVGLGLRETNPTAAIGGNGGTAGPIEFVGVTNKIGNTPMPTRTVAAGSWINLQFNIPVEPVTSFTGDGVLQSTTGKSVLECLALVPNGGLGAYNIYLDNFTATLPNLLAYTLDPGAPAGAAINPTNGVFSWTPTEAQGPNTYNITVRVTDNGSPAMNATKTFSITVNETNQPPALTTISNKIINAGATLTFTNTASDSDIPANALTFSLDPGTPADALIGASSGMFTWTAPQISVTTTNSVTVRVTDNGSPAMSDTKTFNIIVVAPPLFSAPTIATNGTVNLSWQTYPGKNYQVQFKDDLNDANWTNIGAAISATGTDESFNGTASTNVQRFYRILQLD